MSITTNHNLYEGNRAVFKKGAIMEGGGEARAPGDRRSLPRSPWPCARRAPSPGTPAASSDRETGEESTWPLSRSFLRPRPPSRSCGKLEGGSSVRTKQEILCRHFRLRHQRLERMQKKLRSGPCRLEDKRAARRNSVLAEEDTLASVSSRAQPAFARVGVLTASHPVAACWCNAMHA